MEAVYIFTSKSFPPKFLRALHDKYIESCIEIPSHVLPVKYFIIRRIMILKNSVTNKWQVLELGKRLLRDAEKAFSHRHLDTLKLGVCYACIC